MSERDVSENVVRDHFDALLDSAAARYELNLVDIPHLGGHPAGEGLRAVRLEPYGEDCCPLELYFDGPFTTYFAFVDAAVIEMLTNPKWISRQFGFDWLERALEAIALGRVRRVAYGGPGRSGRVLVSWQLDLEGSGKWVTLPGGASRVNRWRVRRHEPAVESFVPWGRRVTGQ